MLNREEISQAVDLQRRSYNLLRWLSTAISKGVIRFDRAHDYTDAAEAAKEWIERHYLNLPPDSRPPTDQLLPFARFFATYMTTSFELVEQPGERLFSSCGCSCTMCTYLVAAPHLKTKKVLRRDKARARSMKITTIQQLARDCDTNLDRQQAEQLLDSADTAMNISLLAYGEQLIARTRGMSVGPAVLALWREIAWDPKGSPKKNFQLEAADIVNAEESLAKRFTTQRHTQ